MKVLAAVLAAGMACLLAPQSRDAANPFLGRWDFTIAPLRADWLGVTAKDGAVEIWFQPTGGNVYQVKDFKLEGSHLTLNLQRAGAKNPALVWELDAAGDKLSGVQKRGDNAIALMGVRAPELKRAEPAAWTTPEPLFNGQDLTGWEPVEPTAENHWTARAGELVNEQHGANLKSTRKFDDFKLHIEYNCPDDGNSGIYLRGRYEVQVEYEPLSKNPPERRIGSIYGFLTPVDMPRKPGEWESFDITLVGRTVTVVRNGVMAIDRQEIPGITGGALDANEGEPGPIYIQGDHTGGLRFRNIRIAVPRR